MQLATGGVDPLVVSNNLSRFDGEINSWLIRSDRKAGSLINLGSLKLRPTASLKCVSFYASLRSKQA